MAGELFKSMAGIDVVHVPYRNSGEARSGVIGGQVQMMIDAVPAMAPNVSARPGARARHHRQDASSVLPDVPTAAEAGVPGYEATIWLGLMAPAGTPKPVIDKLNAAVNEVVKRPDIVKLWTDQGAVPMSMTPEEFDKFLRGDIVKWAEVVKNIRRKAAVGPLEVLSMPSVRFRLNGVETAVDADPDRSLLDVLRGQLGVTGPHFGCGANECGACNVIVGDRAVAACDTPLWSVADKDVTTVEGLGSAATAASAAARFYRRAGLAVRLLRFRHPDERRGAVDAKSQSVGRGCQSRARPQSLPLRFAQPHGPGGAARGGRDGGVDDSGLPRTKLPVSLAANPILSSWVQVLAGRARDGLAGKGGDRTRHRHRAGPDRRRRTRCRYRRACRWFARPRPPAPTRASPRAAFRCSSRAARSGRPAPKSGRSFLTAASDRLGVGIDALDISDGTISGPGNVSTSYWELAGEVSLDRDATPGAVAEIIRAARRWPEAPFSGWIFPTRCSPIPASFTIWRCPACCMAACCGRKCRAQNSSSLHEDGARAVAGLVAIVRDGNFAGVVSETEDGAEAALKALRKGAAWSAGETLPDENDLAAWLKAQPAESTVIDNKTASTHRRRARTIRRQYTRPYIAHASIAPSCAMAQWTGDRVHVWTHSQGVYLLRADLALVLEIAGREYHGRAYGRRRLLRAQRAPTTSRSMPCCWRRRPAAGRSACNGRAKTR